MKFGRIWALTAILLITCLPSAAQKRKIIIDQDAAGPAGTDQQSILLVVQSPQTEVLGVTVVTGDQWLNDWISRITATPDYRSGNTAIFVTWDEGAGDDESNGETCADSAHADTSKYPSCWVPLVVISPSTKPGTSSSTFLTHYSLLATTEDLLGLSPNLGEAATAPSLRNDFGL